MGLRRGMRKLLVLGGLVLPLLLILAAPAWADTGATASNSYWHIDVTAPHTVTPWTNTLDVTLAYDLASPHADPPDNGWYQGVRFWVSAQEMDWIFWPTPPLDEWQSTPFHMDSVTSPGFYGVTGQFMWSSGFDSYDAEIDYDPVKPAFVTWHLFDNRHGVYHHGHMVAAVRRFSDNMAGYCYVSGSVKTLSGRHAGSLSQDVSGLTLPVDSRYLPDFVPVGHTFFPVGSYYAIVHIYDLAGNLRTSAKLFFKVIR